MLEIKKYGIFRGFLKKLGIRLLMKFKGFMVQGKHIVYTDEDVWYPSACNSLGIEPRIHSSYEKSLIERVNQSISE